MVEKLKYQVLDSSMRGDVVFVNELRTDLSRLDGSYSNFAEFRSTVLDDEPSKEMFYLAHYGIPEPNFSRPWSWLSLLLLAASAACVMGWLVMARRSRTSSGSK